ncbi:hypothetical protein C8R43DRAFT_1115797 [Mycena crocata]|nr:hypothetical protein C8R43DRAFT_1115797 [Mycena crocata]
MFNPAFFLQKKAAGRHTPLLHAMPHCCCQRFNPNVVLAPGRRRAAAPALILRYIAFPRAAQNLWAGPPRHEIKCSVVVGSPDFPHPDVRKHCLHCVIGSLAPKFDFCASRGLHRSTALRRRHINFPQATQPIPYLRRTWPEIKIRFLNVPRTSLRRRHHNVRNSPARRDRLSTSSSSMSVQLQVSHFFLCLRRVFGLGFGLTSDEENKQDRVLIDLGTQILYDHSLQQTLRMLLPRNLKTGSQ